MIGPVLEIRELNEIYQILQKKLLRNLVKMHFKTYTKKATLKLTILNLTQNNEHKIKNRNKKLQNDSNY